MTSKRVAVSSVNWSKLAEKLTAEQQAELECLKQQNSTYHTEIVQHEADPPKVDWAALKKKMPQQSAQLEALQKQWDALNIPYGSVPEKMSKEIDKWTQLNQARIQLHEQKTKDGLEDVKKIEAKWAKAPPVEHMYDHTHHIQFFPHEHGFGEKLGYADWRIHHDDGEWRYLEFLDMKEVNADDISKWRRTTHNYNVYPRSGNPEYGYGVGDGSGQPQPPAHWPEPLTELGRKYVKELKERKKNEPPVVLDMSGHHH